MISFVPTRLNDLVVDVLISSPSSSDVLSFNGAKWVNSPAYARKDQSNTFTASQTVVGVLTATAFSGDGTLLNNLDATQISSGTLGDARLSSNVPLKNAANTFTTGTQTIQTGADANKGLVVKLNSGTSTANPVEVQNSVGTPVAFFDTAGGFYLAGSSVFDSGRALSWSSSTSFNVNCFVTGSASTNIVEVGIGGLLVTHNSSNPALDLRVFSSGAGPTDVLTGARQKSHGTSGTGGGGRYSFQSSSSTTNYRDTGAVEATWVDGTDATRKARLALFAYDTAAREGVRVEGTGSAAAIGFLGASAIARPTVTGSRGGNAALASLLTALASLGLLTDSTTA